MQKKKLKITLEIDKVEPLKFYEFDQNNSGGSFTVDKDLCHRLFIQAKNLDEAIDIAERLGCYWNGCEEGMDCDCCGDRWHSSASEVDITKTWPASVYKFEDKAEDRWFKKYGHLPRLEEPSWKKTYSTDQFVAAIKFESIEQYAQFMADEYGWTTPDVRIFYADGTRKEIFMNKIK